MYIFLCFIVIARFLLRNSIYTWRNYAGYLTGPPLVLHMSPTCYLTITMKRKRRRYNIWMIEQGTSEAAFFCALNIFFILSVVCIFFVNYTFVDFSMQATHSPSKESIKRKSNEYECLWTEI